ncbi:MAG TPA: c-type cytochrome [Bacteroidetes bacterium]|nr:c-type cytochrome [Bacteroidota bacterium]
MKRFFRIDLLILFSLTVYALTAQEKPAGNEDLQVYKIAGKQLFAEKNCSSCHTLAAQPEGKLTPIPNMREPEWFATHVKENSQVVLRKERSKRRQRKTAREEIDILKAYLYETTPAERARIDAMAENIAAGAYAVVQNKCLRCHMIAGFGKDTGPDLSDIGTKKDKDWLVEKLIDPDRFEPDTEMKSFKRLPKETLSNMADYLVTLKKARAASETDGQ